MAKSAVVFILAISFNICLVNSIDYVYKQRETKPKFPQCKCVAQNLCKRIEKPLGYNKSSINCPPLEVCCEPQNVNRANITTFSSPPSVPKQKNIGENGTKIVSRNKNSVTEQKIATANRTRIDSRNNIGTPEMKVSKPNDTEMLMPDIDFNSELTIIRANETQIIFNNTISAPEATSVRPNETKSAKQNLNGVCGHRNLNETSVAEGFGNSSATQFPWSVVIFNRNHLEKSDKLCIGTLIHKQVVLTTASCIAGKETSRLMVRAGKWNEPVNESLPLQYRRIQISTTHPNYTLDSYVYNIALLKLSQPFGFADNVNAVCLFDEDYDYNNCMAPGYKVNEFGEETLDLIKLSVMDLNECQKELSESVIGQDFTLYNEFLCAKKVENTNICLTETGSSLVCPLHAEPTRYVQVGMLLWDIQCDTQNVSGVYMDIFENRQWIDEILSLYKRNKNYKTSNGKNLKKFPSKRPLTGARKQLTSDEQDETPKKIHLEYKPVQLNLNFNNNNSWFQIQQQIQLDPNIDPTQ